MKRCSLFLLCILINSSEAFTQPNTKDFTFIHSDLGEVYKYGNGKEILVLIPCVSCRWRSFDEFMLRNGDLYTMYAVTLPGYGGTKAPDIPMWTGDPLWQNHAVVALELMLEKEKLNKVTLIGSSFGSTIAMKLASNRPDLISGLINLDGSFLSSVASEKSSRDDLQESARRIMLQMGLPLLNDYDAWQRFNTPSIHARPDRKLLYHGWFMATDPEVMMQYWRENLLENRNEDFRTLKVKTLDVQAIRPWDKTPEATRRSTEDAVQEVGPPERYELIFLYDTPHFIMEERPELLDEIVRKFQTGQDNEDFRPKTENGKNNE